MSPSAIGTASALNGLWTIVVQLTFLNRIRRWLGISRAYKTLTFGWIIVWLLLPNLRTLLEISETPLPRENPQDPILYPEVRGWITSIGVNLMLSFVTIVGLSNSLLMVLINFSSPDRSALGAVNGISTAVGVSQTCKSQLTQSAWLECWAHQSSVPCSQSPWTERCSTGDCGGCLWCSWRLRTFSRVYVYHRIQTPKCTKRRRTSSEDMFIARLSFHKWNEEPA